MSAAYVKGVAQALPQADISFDSFHVVAMAIEPMEEVRREELRAEPQEVATALLDAGPQARRNLLWGIRKKHSGWNVAQTTAMHWLQRSALKIARAWRLPMALRGEYAHARQHNSTEHTGSELASWISWPGAAGWSRSRSWPPRSRSASLRSCAACWITAATPSSRR